jgi:hypothetical protein
MPFDDKVKDEDILSGLASLHQALTEGFDRIERRFTGVDARLGGLEQKILDVRNDVARLETRMLRRFDDVDGRFDTLETRVTRLEDRIA